MGRAPQAAGRLHGSSRLALMSTVAPRDQVQWLRKIVGSTLYTDKQIERLLAHVGDADLLCSALLMSPRPAWIHQVATGK